MSNHNIGVIKVTHTDLAKVSRMNLPELKWPLFLFLFSFEHVIMAVLLLLLFPRAARTLARAERKTTGGVVNLLSLYC